MSDVEKVLNGWKRCRECQMQPAGMSQAYLDCEYTIGLYCGQSKLVHETVDVLNAQKQEIEQLNADRQSWLKQIADNQLANSPHGYEAFSRQMYLKGVYDGLQMAYEIISGGKENVPENS